MSGEPRDDCPICHLPNFRNLGNPENPENLGNPVQTVALTLFIVWIFSLWLLIAGQRGLPWLSFRPAALLGGLLFFMIVSVIGLLFLFLLVSD